MRAIADRPTRRRRLVIAFAAVLTVPGFAADAAPAAGAAVPVKKVVLFSSGVGYFEHAGTVSGDAVSELRFKTAQINDVLKSLVVEDADGGHVGTIAYPSQDPVAKTLRSFQVDISANPSLGDLLNQLRGAKVSVTLPSEKIEGTILGVEKQKRPAGDKDKTEIVERWVLNLIAGATVRAVVLDEVRQLDLQDPALQGELAKALAALASARDQDKKPVAIHFDGKGERHVRLGYVVEAPVWKASYRLMLPAADAKTKPAIQGWAIVENQTDNDWNGVDLTLVSGRPISFVQDLYQPLYVPRPVVEPELYASLRPQTYEDGLERDKDGKGAVADYQQKLDEAKTRRADAAKPMAMAAAAPGLAYAGGNAARGEFQNRALDPTAGVASIAAAQQVGDFFQYEVKPVDLQRQRSAMIPIVTGEIAAERLSIYNASVLPKHPLLGAKLTNSTTNHLLQGPITVLDGASYAGDARIDNVPPGQDRLISYAIDLEVTVDASQKQENQLVTGSIVDGVLRAKRKLVATQEYLIADKSSKERTVIVEHPLHPQWKLVEPAKAEESTPALHRFRVAVKAKDQAKLTVKEEFVQDEAYAIVDLDARAIIAWSQAGELPKAVREALTQAAAKKQALAETDRQINDRQNRVNEIANDQPRIRQNIASTDRTSPLYARLQAKLNDQETELEKLRDEIAKLRADREKQDQELRVWLTGLKLD